MLTTAEVATKISESFDTQTQGMLIFDDLRQDVNTKVEVDRVNNRVKITEGVFQRDQVNYDLTGWTGRYGKPIELSLALHLSTMAPDFVYNFCMDDDLQTEVHISTIDRKYKVKYYFETEDGTILDKEKVDEVYESLKTAIEVDENATGTDWRSACENGEDVTLFSEDGQIQYPYVPIDLLDDLNTIKFSYYSDNTNRNDTQQESKWIAMVDSEGKPASFYDSNGNIKKIGFDVSGIKVNSDGDFSKTPVCVQDDSIDENVYIGSTEEYVSSTTIDQLVDENLYVYFQDNKKAVEDFGIDGIGISMNGLIARINNGTFDETDPIYEELGYLMMQVDKLVYDIKKYSNEKEDAPEYLKELCNKFIAKHHKNYGKWYKSDGGYYSEKFKSIISDDMSAQERVEKLEKLREECKADYEIIQEASMLIQNDSNKILDDCGGISISTLRLLHEYFNDEVDEIETYEPYIEKVTHHWYNDVYFINEDGSNDGVYDMHEGSDGATITKREEYNPEGLAADDERLNKLNEEGTMYVEMTGKFIEQLKQPEFKKNEPWHYMVKNWLTSGYFFIYDGTMETAEEIEAAKKLLKTGDDKYDSTNPLLIDYNNEKLLVEDKEVVEIDTVKEIDAKAKKLNERLATTEYKDGKKYRVRLQKINFAKKSSLAAFSILEGVHTEDGEAVYHDLKEFMIELGYFTESDFETIETGVLDWMIPEYVPDEWPDLRYEKKNDEYGTYIRSKSSIDKQREEEEKKLEEASKKEEQIADGNTEVSDGNVENSENTSETEEAANKTEKDDSTGETVLKSATYEEFAQSGEGYETIITVNGITYKNFKQGDFPNIPYSEGSIATSGCGATSTAIVLSGYGYDISVPDVANWITANSVPTSWEANQKALEHYGGITSQVIYGSSTNESTKNYVEQIRKAFSEGKPVIANVKPSAEGNNLYTSFGHYIVLLGEDQDGTVLVSDPNGRGVDNIKNKYTPGLEELVRLYLTEASSVVGGILIPDQAPTGVSFKKKELLGFEAGLEVITPGEAEVIKIEENSITLKFTAENKVKDWTMKIEGFAVNKIKDSEESLGIEEGTKLEKGAPIGITTDSDIKLLMRDNKKAIINNIEDYMKLPEKKSGNIDGSEYDFFYFTYYESGKWCTEGNGPASVGACQPGIEHGVGICQWTTMTNGLSNIQKVCGKLAELDSDLCGILAKYADMDCATLINQYAMQPTFEDSYLKRDFQHIANRDRDRFLELQMQISIEEKYAIFDDLGLSWIKERPAVVQGTLGSLVNWGPYMGWEDAINESMSDEEIIINLLKYACTKTSTVGSLNSRWNPQAKAALDILHGELDAKKLLEEENYGTEYGTGGKYVNFLSTQ